MKLTVYTQQSNGDPAGWTNVVGNWGTADPNVLMESLGNNLFGKTIPIKSFYNVLPNQEVLQIGFVFRNTDGSLVGRLGDDSDIFIPINQETISDYISHTFINNKLTIQAENADVIIEPYTSEIIKVGIFPNHLINPDSSFVVVLEPQFPSTNLYIEPEYIKLSLPEIDVLISKFPVRIYFLNGNDTILADNLGFYWQFDNKGINFGLKEDESIYGTGSRGLPVNRRGNSYRSYNAATYDYIGPVKEKNITIPFIISSEHYGIYFQNHTPGYFDIGNFNSGVFDYCIEFGDFSYFAIFGEDDQDLLESYYPLNRSPASTSSLVTGIHSIPVWLPE